MIYNSLNEFIKELELDIYEYYTECYDIQGKILGDPIYAFSKGNYSILGFESKTKDNVNLTSFKDDEKSSKLLFKELQKSKFYFTLWFDKNYPDELHANQKIFTTDKELKGFMINFLREKVE